MHQMSSRRYVNAETHLSIRLNAGTTSVNGIALVISICISISSISIWPVFSVTTQPNTNGLLFEPNRI